MAKVNLVEKTYRLRDDRSGESFMLKTGKNRRLLIFDTTKNFNRAIRHCPNEKSIFLDEQSVHALVEPIIFEFGLLIVPATEQLTQKFLDSHPDNAANNGGWFEEVNEEAVAEVEVEMEDLIHDIKQAVREKEKEKEGIHALETVAAVILNSIKSASKMTTAELKRTIYNKADEDPKYFTDDAGNVNIFDDKDVERQYLTLRAISDGIIQKSQNNKSMVWVKTGKTITTAPAGTDLVEFFADFLSTDEGILVIEQITKLS